MNLICLTSLHKAFFSGVRGGNFIGISLKPSDILSATCMSSILFFSSAVVVLLPFGESPLMKLSSFLKNLKLQYTGRRSK